MLELAHELVARPLANLIIAVDGLIGGRTVITIIMFAALSKAGTIPLAIRQTRNTRLIARARGEIDAVRRTGGNAIDQSRQMASIFSREGISGPGCLLTSIAQLTVVVAVIQALHLVVNGDPAVPYAWNGDTVTGTLMGIPLDGRHRIIAGLGVATLVATIVQQQAVQLPTDLDERQTVVKRVSGLAVPLAAAVFCMIWPLGVALYCATYAVCSAATTPYIERRAQPPVRATNKTEEEDT